jgi:hypothetical protein
MYSSTFSLTSAPDGVGGQHHAPKTLLPEDKLGTHFIGGWVDPKTSVDGRGISHPHRASIPEPPSP